MNQFSIGRCVEAGAGEMMRRVGGGGAHEAAAAERRRGSARKCLWATLLKCQLLWIETLMCHLL